MQNVVILQKDEDGALYCRQITEEGLKFMGDQEEEDYTYWEPGGTILLEELMEILDKER